MAPPIDEFGERTKIDWRGEAKVAPGQTLVLGLEHEKQSLRTNSTGTVSLRIANDDDRETDNRAGYHELQSEFAKRVLPGVEHSLRR